MLKQNLHTHTTYADGRDTPEELIREAIARGFDSLGFSEHARVPYSSYPSQLTKEKAVRYQNEIGELKKTWEGRISLFCGLEDDFYADTELDGYDYLIGSVHYLDCDGAIKGFDRRLEEALDYVKVNFGGSGLAFGGEACFQLFPERAFKVDDFVFVEPSDEKKDDGGEFEDGFQSEHVIYLQ